MSWSNRFARFMVTALRCGSIDGSLFTTSTSLLADISVLCPPVSYMMLGITFYVFIINIISIIQSFTQKDDSVNKRLYKITLFSGKKIDGSKNVSFNVWLKTINNSVQNSMLYSPNYIEIHTLHNYNTIYNRPLDLCKNLHALPLVNQ